MKENEVPQTDSLEETPNEGKKKKFKIRFTTTSILIMVIVVMAVGITGYSTHSYIKVTPSFCATCHNMESHVDSYLTSDHLDNIHAQANVMCKDCHSNYTLVDEMKSLVVYVTGGADDVIRRIKVEDDMCLQCHIDKEYLAAQTAYLVRNPHDSHWPDLKCTTCHLSHENQANYCAQCHDNGNQRMIENLYDEIEINIAAASD